MPINFEDVLKTIQENDDIVENSLILRLYDEYEKNDIEKSDEKVSLAKIQNAYNRISINIENMKINDKLSSKIMMYYIILKSDMDNFSIKDKKNIEKTVDLITILEALLKLDITFINNVENCLEKQLYKEKTNKRMR